MARPAFDRLSFLDSTFLIAESTTNHMHVAGTATYEAGPLRCADGGIDIERIRDYVSSRLHAHPALPPGAGLHADRGPPGVGGRPALQHRRTTCAIRRCRGPATCGS